MAETEALREQVARFAEELEIVEAQTADAEAALPEARSRERDAREAAQQARLKARQLETEVATLVKLLMPDAGAKWRPAVDAIRVSPGYEIALGAALTDDLDAGLDKTAPVRWTIIAGDGDPALPEGAIALNAFVDGPEELARRLAQIGVVDRAVGSSLQPMLRPGQRLVSREGDVWRWDGFVAAGDAPTAAAKRLSERNRLGDLEQQVAAYVAQAGEAEQLREAASDAVNRAQQEEKLLRDRWRRLQNDAAIARDTLAKADRVNQEHKAKLASLTEGAKRFAEAREEAAAQQAEAELLLGVLAPAKDLDARLAALLAQRLRQARRLHGRQIAGRRHRAGDPRAPDPPRSHFRRAPSLARPRRQRRKADRHAA